jgi:hypothetical protein
MKQILNILPILTITACSDYSNAFDCSPKPGMGCQSISEIHEKIEERAKGNDELTVPEDAEEQGGGLDKCKTCSGSRRRALPELAPATGYLVATGSGHVQRIPERVVRVWVNGRVNEAGDYEAPHYVYVALKDDGWQSLKRQGVLRHDD